MTSITQIPSVTRRRIGVLRRKIGLWIAADALSLLAVVVVALIALSLLLDWYFHMDRPQRLIMLLLMVAAAAHVIFHHLFRPLRRKPDDEALCIAVEHHHPELGDQLISALQFAAMKDEQSPGSSRALMNVTIAASEDRARAVDFTDILDRRSHKRHLMRGGAALIVLLAAIALMPGTMALWFQRNIALGDEAWPQRTHLHIEGLSDGGVLILPRGDDLELHVQADTKGEIPQAVYVDYRLTSSGHGPAGASAASSGSEQMVGSGDGKFTALFPNVLEEMRLRVRGGDATADCQVQLVDRPTISAMQLTVDPPEYTKLDSHDLPADQSAFSLLVGSTLHLRITASKPLSGVTMTMGNNAIGPMNSDDDQHLVWQATIAPDQIERGALVLTLTDTTGLSGKRPIRLDIRPIADKAPTVRARLEGIGDLITPRATLPIRMEATDDFAVTGMALSYRHGAALEAESTQAPPAKLTLPTPADQPMPAKHVESFMHRWSIESLNLPADSQLTFVIEATDNDAVSGAKVGQSQTFSLKVVNDQELRAQLLRREQEQRMEFERLLRDQQQLLVDTQAMIAGTAGGTKPLNADMRQQLGDLEKKQRLVSGRTTAIGDQFSRILAETLNNQLETPGSPAQIRLQQRIVDPLNQLAATGIPPAADLLNETRKPTLSPADRKAALDQAAGQQQQVIDAMQAILKNMVKLEGFQEAINLLREIRRAELEVKQQTDREKNKKIEDIFNP